MLVDVGLVDGDGPAADRNDGSALGFLVEETGGGEDDLFSGFPVDVFADSQSGVAGEDGGADLGPGGGTRSTIHGEFALHAADTLVAVHRDLLSVVPAVHDEG